MTNEISESVIPANATDTQLTAAAIQQRAQEMIEHASLEQVKTRLPDYVPVVESLIADLDFKNPLTLARVGSWALEGQATAGLELLSAVQQSPCQDAVTLVDQFGSELSKRIKPLEARQEAQNQKLIARQSWRTKTLAKFSAIFSSKDGVRTNQSKQLNDDMADLKATNALLNTVIVDTVADTQELIATLKANRGIPEMIQEQVENAKIVHADAAEKIYLSLVAVNEYRDDLEYNQIPELQAKAIDQAALPEDLDILTLAKDGLALLETRRTDLMAAFLNTALQHRMVAEMGKINANQATEMERLEAIALPQMLSTIGTMALQQRTGEQITGAIAANRILSDASKSNANGFTRVLELSKQADAAKLDAAKSIVAATGKTLKAIEDFRVHEAGHIERQREVQKDLVESIGKLRAAAVKVNSVMPDKSQTTVDTARTEQLVQTITGVSLAEMKNSGKQDNVSTPVLDVEVVEVTVEPKAKRPVFNGAANSNKTADMFASIKNGQKG